MKKITNFLTVIFMLITLGGTLETDAQTTPKLKFDQSGHVRYIKFDGKNKTGKWESPSSPESFFSNVLGAQEQDEFVLKSKREDNNSTYYEHYRQFYKGVEVEGGLFILQFNSGKITKANGHYVNTTGVDPSPELTPEDAAKSYADYLKVPADHPLKFLHGTVITEIETVSGKDTTYITRLCYKIDLLDSLANNGETGYIDAHTGKVLKTQQNWNDNSATGTFATLYSGTENAGTQYYSNTYNLIDSSRNAIINTWDLNNAYYTYYAANAVEFTDDDNNWTSAEHSANHDQMALDIHWALQEIYDYFDTNHSLQSFDGNNHMIDAFVHCYLPDGSGGWTKDNAGYNTFANGDQAFFFGDGQTTFKPLAALDVVAHEYAHGITHNFTGLSNNYEVQRAINEGLSDIWGAILENAVAPGKDCWKIGEEVINVSGDDCLRNLQEPESSTANTKIANTYGDNVYTTGDYYAKSGVMSHWLYLLANGGIGMNNNYDNYTIYGLGFDYAAMIVFEGQTGHFGSITSYADARDATIDASDDIFGANSFQSLQVANAWYAVGVGSNPGRLLFPAPILFVMMAQLSRQVVYQPAQH